MEHIHFGGNKHLYAFLLGQYIDKLLTWHTLIQQLILEIYVRRHWIHVSHLQRELYGLYKRKREKGKGSVEFLEILALGPNPSRQQARASREAGPALSPTVLISPQKTSNG